MPICAISTCKNSSYHTRKLESNTNGIIFHRFPLNEPERAKEWFSVCMRSDRKKGIPKSQDAICSDHFLPSDYERDLEHELLNLPPRKKGKLKPTAIPSVNLPGNFKLSGTANATSRIKKNSRSQSKYNRQSNLRKKMGVCGRTQQSSIQDDLEDSMAASLVPKDEYLRNPPRALMEPPEEKRLKNGMHCQLLLRSMFLDETLMDVTLRTQEKTLKAHRVVLRQASGYFKKLLSLDMSAECEVRFNDLEYEDLLKIIAFIYLGEVTVEARHFDRFLRVAENLEVFSLLPGSSLIEKPAWTNVEESSSPSCWSQFDIKEEMDYGSIDHGMQVASPNDELTSCRQTTKTNSTVENKHLGPSQKTLKPEPAKSKIQGTLSSLRRRNKRAPFQNNQNTS